MPYVRSGEEGIRWTITLLLLAASTEIPKDFATSLIAAFYELTGEPAAILYSLGFVKPQQLGEKELQKLFDMISKQKVGGAPGILSYYLRCGGDVKKAREVLWRKREMFGDYWEGASGYSTLYGVDPEKWQAMWQRDPTTHRVIVSSIEFAPTAPIVKWIIAQAVKEDKGNKNSLLLALWRIRKHAAQFADTPGLKEWLHEQVKRTGGPRGTGSSPILAAGLLHYCFGERKPLTEYLATVSMPGPEPMPWHRIDCPHRLRVSLRSGLAR